MASMGCLSGSDLSLQQGCPSSSDAIALCLALALLRLLLLLLLAGWHPGSLGFGVLGAPGALPRPTSTSPAAPSAARRRAQTPTADAVLAGTACPAEGAGRRVADASTRPEELLAEALGPSKQELLESLGWRCSLHAGCTAGSFSTPQHLLPRLAAKAL